MRKISKIFARNLSYHDQLQEETRLCIQIREAASRADADRERRKIAEEEN